MTQDAPILVLAGTQEARLLCDTLHDRGIPTLASLAGATREAAKLPVSTRVGGFGGSAGFVDYVQSNRVRAVVDATHPFAHRISGRTHRICQERDLPYLQILRPGWSPVDGDIWHFIDTEADAAALIPADATVFLATGRQTLGRFGTLRAKRIICRQIDPPTEPFPFPGGEYLVGRPPFSVEDERDLFQELGIHWLIVKNAGGDSSATKLTAARQLGIPVIMINRPAPAAPSFVETVDEALDWIDRL